MTQVERTVVLPTTVDEVWRLLTEPEELSRWFGGDVALDARPGGAGSFRLPDGDVRAAEVLDVEPGRRLRWCWWPIRAGAEGRGDAASTVELTLEEDGDGTRVRVVESVPVAAGGTGVRACARRWDDLLGRVAGVVGALVAV